MFAAQPWPLPSAQDLADAIHQFSLSLSSGDGSGVALNQLLLNKEQFMSSDIWLTRQQVMERGEFDRNSRVKEV